MLLNISLERKDKSRQKIEIQIHHDANILLPGSLNNYLIHPLVIVCLRITLFIGFNASHNGLANFSPTLVGVP